MPPRENEEGGRPDRTGVSRLPASGYVGRASCFRRAGQSRATTAAIATAASTTIVGSAGTRKRVCPYVTDGIASAMAQAKAAAGDRDVFVIGAYTAQHALEAGVLDELVIHQIPVLFGDGRWLFEVLPSRVELEIVRVIDTPEATHIRYRVRR